LIQSILGGIAIFVLILAWFAIISLVGGPELLQEIFVFILVLPAFVFSIIFHMSNDDLIGRPTLWAWLLGLGFQIIVCSLISYLLIELTDPNSDFRCAIRGAYLAVKSKVFYMFHPVP